MSIEINKKNFDLLFPELKIDEKLFSMLKVFADREISEKAWGKFYEEGVLTLIAHLLQLRNNSVKNLGAGNYPVSSTSVGSVSVGFSVPSSSDNGLNYFNNTAYGQRYLQLRSLTKQYIIVV